MFIYSILSFSLIYILTVFSRKFKMPDVPEITREEARSAYESVASRLQVVFSGTALVSRAN